MHTSIDRLLCAVALALCALLACSKVATLRELPPGVTLSQLAEQTAGNAHGAVLASAPAADEVEYPTKLKVWYSRYGTLSHDDIVDFTWDAAHPPLQLGSAADRERDPNPLCLFEIGRAHV